MAFFYFTPKCTQATVSFFTLKHVDSFFENLPYVASDRSNLKKKSGKIIPHCPSVSYYVRELHYSTVNVIFYNITDTEPQRT